MMKIVGFELKQGTRSLFVISHVHGRYKNWLLRQITFSCVLTTVNPDSGEKSDKLEPLRELRKYRLAPGKLYDLYKVIFKSKLFINGVWFAGKPSFWCEHGHRKAGTCEYGRYCLHTVQTKSILNQKLQFLNDWLLVKPTITITMKQISLCAIFSTVTRNIIRLFANLSKIF